ncbi:S-layer homology domain-containing protein [Sporomusa termitida]|uniref:S-layer homology domain protein n=1 Tax=Sporomusa termitida TaxID=2377 RepID=A0A517DVV0_9FIRM|nr:S-layer homology domain-containing protein [Sporomusa termitida]QDR81480.1 S-layer homology domain protein [Sporomusa termitida]
MNKDSLKKKLLATLTFAALAGFTASALAAAPNPFGDVPAKHWAYEAVNKLKQEGLIDGDGTGSFQGERTVTRYEMAQMVARAVWNAEKAGAEDKALIDKLATEFTNELNSLGVRMEAVEKKSDKLTFNGFLHLSEQVWDNSGDFKNSTGLTGDTPHPRDGHYPALGIDLYINYKVNDKWQVKIEDEAVRDFRSGGYWSNGGAADGSVSASQRYGQMYAEGLVGATTVKAGKFDYGAAYGLMVAPGRKGVEGVQFAVGEKSKTILTYGYFRQSWAGNATNPYIISSTTDNRYAALEFNTALAGDANVKAAYHHLTSDGADAKVFADRIRLWEIGADKIIAKDLQLFAAFGQSNAPNQNKAYIAGLNYKRAELTKPGSYGLTARYIRAEAKSSIAPDNYWVSKYDWGLEGPELSGMVMVDKNVGIMFWASSLKATDGIHTGKLNTVKAELDFFF